MAGVGEMGERVRSTVFKTKAKLSKDEQEERVAAIFAEGYRREKSIALGKGRRVRRDPPDWVFSGSALTVGVEMFELFQFYPSRALMDDLTNAIYSEFEQRRLSERYLGVCVHVLVQEGTRERLERGWEAKGIQRPVRRTARELVDLVSGAVSSRDAIPEGDMGRRSDVDAVAYPALAVLCKSLIVHRCLEQDARRSDGKAAPLVILSSGDHFADEEMEQRVGQMLSKKMADRSRWSVSADRSILVAHDLPREQFYEGFDMEWGKWLKRAAIRWNALSVFDEVWFVTFQTLEGKAHLVCSRDI